MEWVTSDVPDPQDPRTFEASRLDWSELEKPSHAELLDFTRRLITIRRSYPDFTDPRFEEGRALSNDEAGWLLLERGDMVMVVNFGDHPTEVNVGRTVDPVIIIGPSSATAADATQYRVFAPPRRPAAAEPRART
jgi:maltooligosyltrehalose trehalohydrolase